jgi:hypothetical protein
MQSSWKPQDLRKVCTKHKTACVSFSLRRLFETFFAQINISRFTIEICAETILMYLRVSVHYACLILIKLKLSTDIITILSMSDFMKIRSVFLNCSMRRYKQADNRNKDTRRSTGLLAAFKKKGKSSNVRCAAQESLPFPVTVCSHHGLKCILIKPLLPLCCIHPGSNFWTIKYGTIFLTSVHFKRSRYSDWLRAGRLRDQGSSTGRVKNFHFSMLSRPALGSTQPPIQWVPGALSRGKAAWAWSWPLTSN